jgi:hypothetical protein
MTGHNGMTRIALMVTLASALAGCASEAGDDAALGVADQGLESANGLMRNGLMRNGLMRNGLMRNGLMRNGLTENGLMRNGLLTDEFKSWFDEDPATSATFMEYLVRCAASEGADYSFTSPTTGLLYTWTGSLGLAPGFASGLEATVAEQQVLSACLGAHTNYYGQHVDMAVEGYLADGAAIPKVPNETETYWVREAAFFGNLFDPAGALYACRDHREWPLGYSSARACAFGYRKGDGPGDLCAPIVYVDACSSYCSWSKRDQAYTTCKYGGQAYLPITTRMLPTDVFQCGDGVCQFTEHCGSGNTYDSCLADCGACSATTSGTTSTTDTATILKPWAKP